MVAVTITQITPPELENLIENSLRRILNNSTKIPAKQFENGEREVLDSFRAASLTGLSKSHLYVLAGSGRIPNFKKGNRIWFYKDELLKWMESGRRHNAKEIQMMADNSLKSA